jgi:hypothetical protein
LVKLVAERFDGIAWRSAVIEVAAARHASCVTLPTGSGAIVVRPEPVATDNRRPLTIAIAPIVYSNIRNLPGCWNVDRPRTRNSCRPNSWHRIQRMRTMLKLKMPNLRIVWLSLPERSGNVG